MENKKQKIDKKTLQDSIQEFYAQDQMPPYLVDQLGLLVEGFQKKRNFSGYGFLDEMKSYAYLRLIKQLNKKQIDPKENCFGYMSRIVDWAFQEYIKKEKKYSTYHDLQGLTYNNEIEDGMNQED